MSSGVRHVSFCAKEKTEMQTDHLSSAAHDVMAAVSALEPEIKAQSATIEVERRLPPALAHHLMEAGVFRMGTPREYGGGELDPMSQVRVVEELSRIEGSVGWLSMISTAGSFIPAFLEPATAKRLFGAIESVVAGQVRPPHRADLVEGGYRLSATYHFGSGCQHASVITCGCHIYENGELRRYGRHPEYRVLLVPASKASIVDVWDTTGMRGTGSNDIVLDNVFVPFSDSTTMMEKPHTSGPLYRFPALFLVSHAGVPLGIARNALDFVEELTTQKKAIPSGQLMREDPTVQETIAWAEAHLGAARSYVYSTLEELWETLCKGDRPSPRQRAAYRMMMTYSHQAAKQLITTLYDTAATSAIFRSSRLDRDARDILTACQHRVVHLRMYRPAGRLLLGLDPEEPLF
ncbi:MAG TPA: acyl-CoA dehydrogenase family protein [Candidatus Binataceae bacterium]|nr:acyl-CoA dehydrogenase family protein [Candidatus Binataceae bacterium]